MTRRDGKNKFYRTLNLDKETKKILKWFRDIKQQMINDEIEEIEDNESNQN